MQPEALATPLDEAERQSLLQAAARTREAALQQLQSHPHQAQFPIRFVAELGRAVDKVVQSRAEAGLKTDCHAGCSHCCSLPVQALPAEVFAVAQAVQQREAAERQQLLQRLQQHAQRTANGTHIDRTLPCPFLQQQRCSIYAVRPAVCRKAHSLDVRACEQHAAQIPQDLDLVLRAEALTAGVTEAYQAHALPSRGHAFAPAVWLALQDDSAQPRWLAGEAVFDGLGPAAITPT
jgi:uncharacterized protein